MKGAAYKALTLEVRGLRQKKRNVLGVVFATNLKQRSVKRT